MAIKKLVQTNGDDLLVSRAEFDKDGNPLVASVDGKGLSTNDFTNEDKNKLDSLQVLQQASNTVLGGIKADAKTDEDTQEVKIDATTGKLYVKPGQGTVSDLLYEEI